MQHRIIVAGIGPGNVSYIVPEALQAIREAKVLVGGKRALAQFADESRQETKVIDRDIAAVMSFIREKLGFSDVVVMVSGDPGYYSLLDALRREFPIDILRVIPGISSVQLAFAKLALPWHDADLLSFHGRVPEESKLFYAKGRLLGILTDGTYNSHTIPQLLLEKGWDSGVELVICSRLSYEDEEIVQTTLGKAMDFPVYKHCILVVKA